MDQIQSLMPHIQDVTQGLVIRNAVVSDQGGAFDQQQVDVACQGGKIKAVGTALPPSGYELDAKGAHLTTGFFDLKSVLNDPGLEGKDTWDHLQASALAGGYTDVCVLSNEVHAFDQSDIIENIRRRSQHAAVTFHPLAAATVRCKGTDMAELMNLMHHGAVAFQDILPIRYENIVVGIMRYLSQMDGLLIQQPHTPIWASPQMHEGIDSTMLGMPGYPAFAEEMAVQRELGLARYTNGRIHMSCISTSGAVDQIRKAKAEGLKVTCDVAAYQMSFTAADLHGFDTHLKVFPPLREANDRDALWEGLADGTIDAITSNHSPQDLESKRLEFDLAEYGIVSLETALSGLMTSKPDHISLDRIISLLNHGPREVLGLRPIHIEQGADAKLTLIEPGHPWVFQNQDIYSRSKNSPFIGKDFKGKVVATIAGQTLYQNRG